MTLPPPDFPYPFIAKVLFTPEEIEARVNQLGAQITQDYKTSEKLLLLGLLRGSVMFITDLMRKVHHPMTPSCASRLTTKPTSPAGT